VADFGLQPAATGPSSLAGPAAPARFLQRTSPAARGSSGMESAVAAARPRRRCWQRRAEVAALARVAELNGFDSDKKLPSQAQQYLNKIFACRELNKEQFSLLELFKFWNEI
jgi:hypothetical protein